MEQNNLTHEESLRLIGGMIQTAQNKFTDNSSHYLLWGYLVALASFIHYVLIRLGLQELAWVPWPILMTAGGIIAGIMGYRSSKKAQVTTYTDRVAGFVWGGMVIVMFALLIQGASLGWQVVYPILMLLWGWALFISGGMIRFTPLILGGIYNWAMGIFAFYQPFDVQLLLIATSMVATYLIPGYMLKLKVKRDAA
jgi:hypothetical protein